MGMDGAAMSQLLSYTLFYLLLLILVKIKLGINILSLAHVKVIVLLIGLVIMNHLCQRYIGPVFFKLPCSEKVAFFAESIVRSLFLLMASIWVCYKWNISDEINRIIRKALRIKE
jgi:hypothetical protein